MLAVSGIAWAQSSGAIQGKVLEKGTNKPLDYANVRVFDKTGKVVGGAYTDEKGVYVIRGLEAGRYDVVASYAGYGQQKIENVEVGTKITFVDFYLTPGQTLKEVVVEYKKELVQKDNTSQGSVKTKETIEKMPGRSAIAVAATAAGVVSLDGGIASIRGARSDATDMYIDGVKVVGSSALPKAALEQVEVITGGLSPEYGDATGGIINVTTRSATRDFGLGVEFVTSSFLDPYNYNILGFSMQGPFISSYPKDTTTGKRIKDPVKKFPILSYFLAGELSYIKDPNPFAKGLWVAKDDYLKYIENNPLRPTGTGFGAFMNAEFVTKDDLRHIKSKINSPSRGINLSGKLDVRTTENIRLTFGGSIDYSNDIDYIHSYSLFNYKEYPQVINNTWRVFGRFTHKLLQEDKNADKSKKEEASKRLIKNVFYSIQLDYSKINSVVQNPDFKDDLFKYGYWGKFKTYKAKSYELGNYSYKGVDYYNVYLLNNYYDTLVTFEPSDLHPVTAKYTEQYYSLYPLHSGLYRNYTLLQNGHALLNGQEPYSVYGLWAAPGTVYSQYSKSDASQIGVNVKLSADVKYHSIQFGFQYEQRKEAYISYSPVALWIRARELANKHIEQLDSIPIFKYNADGVFLDTIEFDRLYDAKSQSFFDINMRKALGLPVNSTEWLDVDNYDPSFYKINWFSADELLNEGNYYVYYYGFDHTGKKLKTKPSFDDFFNKTDEYGNYTRLIPAFEPIYMAAYVQDKFSFEDLIFNIGVRVDRFDANQKVLKDKYLFYEARTVKEVTNLGPHPSNMGPDYVVYVDNVANPTQILGYRNGDKWYNAQGIEIQDPSLIKTSSGIAPYLVDPTQTKPNSKAFKDYDPQYVIMPRIAFSFPISDQAVFFAHYDVLSKRPTSGLRMSPLDYYFIQAHAQEFISNPSLKPEKTIDYELGFQQALNKTSALKMSAYYREMRDMVQAYRYYGAYPIDYYSFNNIDFGTVKGLSITYLLAKQRNITMEASYTLQFADGTGSSATSSVNLVRTGQPNLRILNPLDFDRRHSFSLTFDLRYPSDNYNGPVIKRNLGGDKVKEYRILQNTGLSVTLTGGSGTPYSKSSNVISDILGGGNPQLQGMINGSRLPWSFRIDARLDRDIVLRTKTEGEKKRKEIKMNVYLEVLNVLNAKNIIAVYRSTGNPDDDGYLAAPEYQAGINAQNDPEAFRLLYSLRVDDPYHYSLPRRTRLGIILNLD
jgi:outer membrane receptor protein involved in Fe transport